MNRPVSSVCVFGGGVIGTLAAYYLAREGLQVTVLERLGGVGLEASFGNGGQLSYDYVAPLAEPAVLSKLPAWLLSPGSPLRFRPRLEPEQWAWCLAFLRACRRDLALQVTADLLRLAARSRALMETLAQEEALDFDYEVRGKLVVFRSARSFEAARRQMAFQARLGSRQVALDRDGCVDAEPALAPVAHDLAGGVLTATEAAGDCHSFTEELARRMAARHGVVFRYGCRVLRLRREGALIRAAQTSMGEIEADAFVVAAGLGSRDLLRPLGLSLPVYPLGGYSLTAPVEDGDAPPAMSVTDADRKLVFAPLGRRLRVAGMVDLVGLRADPDPGRMAALAHAAEAVFPLGGRYGSAVAWGGWRPATPTSKPILGASPYANLWLNTGHGALGFTLACVSGRATADLVLGRTCGPELAPFSLSAHGCAPRWAERTAPPVCWTWAASDA